jgi:hypothetical protein
VTDLVRECLIEIVELRYYQVASSQNPSANFYGSYSQDRWIQGSGGRIRFQHPRVRPKHTLQQEIGLSLRTHSFPFG